MPKGEPNSATKTSNCKDDEDDTEVEAEWTGKITSNASSVITDTQFRLP